MILLYEPADAERNREFIRELERFGDFDLLLWDDWSIAGLSALAAKLSGFTVLNRTRQPGAMRFLEDHGVRLMNRAEVNRIANDKWQSFGLLTLLGVPASPTYREPQAYPCVMKPVGGHGGHGVDIIHSPAEIPAFAPPLVFQPIVEHNGDVRAYVIGGKVVVAVKRSSAESFKANYTLGGEAAKYELSAAQEQDVFRIARALKSDYVGIDFLLLPD
ncbi:MAG TPA: alpha-L-glutamate ligase, partial [Planococcus sp. (in: firmicutes)]|nr:alpha-L-glutamate ligase [Planococcus sp. (in: firmicutes)]